MKCVVGRDEHTIAQPACTFAINLSSLTSMANVPGMPSYHRRLMPGCSSAPQLATRQKPRCSDKRDNGAEGRKMLFTVDLVGSAAVGSPHFGSWRPITA